MMKHSLFSCVPFTLRVGPETLSKSWSTWKDFSLNTEWISLKIKLIVYCFQLLLWYDNRPVHSTYLLLRQEFELFSEESIRCLCLTISCRDHCCTGLASLEQEEILATPKIANLFVYLCMVNTNCFLRPPKHRSHNRGRSSHNWRKSFCNLCQREVWFGDLSHPGEAKIVQNLKQFF